MDANNRSHQLPSKPSALLSLALQDLRACEADNQYVINMSVWHGPSQSYAGVCEVCFVGAVLAKSLHFAPHILVNNVDFWVPDPTTHRALHTLEMFRLGNVHTALRNLHDLDSPPQVIWPPDREIPEHAVDREGFHAAMQQLCTELAAVGL